MEGTSKGKGKGRKIGRNAAKCKRYREMGTCNKNKCKRVLKSNGREFAESWAAPRGLLKYLKSLYPVGLTG